MSGFQVSFLFNERNSESPVYLDLAINKNIMYRVQHSTEKVFVYPSVNVLTSECIVINGKETAMLIRYTRPSPHHARSWLIDTTSVGSPAIIRLGKYS